MITDITYRLQLECDACGNSQEFECSDAKSDVKNQVDASGKLDDMAGAWGWVDTWMTPKGKDGRNHMVLCSECTPKKRENPKEDSSD